MEQNEKQTQKRQKINRLLGGLICLMACIVLFTACKNSNNGDEHATGEIVDPLTYDSLPEAKWNGEYMKVKDEDEEKKPKRRGFSSDFLNLGQIDLTLADKVYDIHLFEGKKNALSFHNNMIKALVKSEKNEFIDLEFRKPGILTNYKGSYQAATHSQVKNGVHLKIQIGKGSDEQVYTLTSGAVKLLNFSPQNGNLEVSFEGDFTNKEGTSVKGKGKLKMRFDVHVMVLED